MSLTHALGPSAECRVVGCLVDAERGSRFKQRGLYHLSVPGLVTCLDGRQDAEGEEHAGGYVGDSDRQTVRRTGSWAAGAHQPRHALSHQIEAAAIGIGSGLTEA